MPAYYNLTKLTEGDGGIIDTMGNMSTLVPVYPLFILVACFIVSYAYLTSPKSKGTTLDPNDAINYSMFFTLLLSIFLYVGGIVKNSQYIYLCAVVYLITLIIRFYNKY